MWYRLDKDILINLDKVQEIRKCGCKLFFYTQNDDPLKHIFDNAKEMEKEFSKIIDYFEENGKFITYSF